MRKADFLVCALVLLLSAPAAKSALAQAASAPDEPEAPAGPGPAVGDEPASGSDAGDEAGRKYKWNAEGIDSFRGDMEDIFGEHTLYAGILFAVVGLPFLVWGWRIYRFLVGLYFGLIFGAVAFALAVETQAVSMPVALACAGGAGLVGLLIGWFVYKIVIALYGGLVCGVICAALGMLSGVQIAAVGAGLAGFVLGACLGWKLALYIAALIGSNLGSGLCAAGVALLTPGLGDNGTTLTLYSLPVLWLLGFVWQAAAVYRYNSRQAGRPPAQRPQARPAPQGG